jgi:SPP1 family predicted phage head-tail adaptor
MTTFLTDAELTAMRDVQGSHLPEIIYIQSLTKTSNGAGGWTEVWNTSATANGRISATSGKELLLAGKVTSSAMYTVTLSDDTALTTKNRLQINGEQYQVVSLLNRSEQTALRVICEKLM